MKKLLLLLAGGISLSVCSSAQTTLFQDDFESGSGNWTLNGGSGNNVWIVNSEYLGYSGIVADTPDQPSAITNYPNSSYLHIHNTDACSFLSICNASFDTGSSSNQPAKISTPINATGYSNITLSFYYLCAGVSGSAYGTIEYSLDNGGSWVGTGTNYVNISAWTSANVTLPAWDNAASLSFRFRWQNGSTGNDPAFAIDQLSIVGTAGSFATLQTGSPSTTGWCANTATNTTVNFTANGTINAGNTYTAQLSNANGSFVSPTTIGTLSSTATGNLSISAVIPAGTPSGNGYRIRVNASNPATTGTDNGTDLVIHAQPTILVISNPADGMMCPGESVTLLASGGISYLWSPSSSLDNANLAQAIASPSATTPYTVIGTDANGCSNTSNFTVTVQNCAEMDEHPEASFSLYPNPATDQIQLLGNAANVIESVTIIDASGKRFAAILTNGQLSITPLTSGTYILQIKYAAGISTLRFVKN